MRKAVAIVENFWHSVWQSKNPDIIDRLVTDDFGVTTGGVDLFEGRIQVLGCRLSCFY